MRIGGKDVEGSYVVSGPAVIAEQLPDSHPSKKLAIDFVTNYVDFKEDYLIYHSPEAMFRLAKSLTKRVVLRHDYPLYEFCLYLYPDFHAWGRTG